MLSWKSPEKLERTKVSQEQSVQIAIQQPLMNSLSHFQPGPNKSPLRLILQVHGTDILRKLGSLRHQSKLLVTLITLFLGGYAFFAFWLFHLGLRFIGRFPGLGPLLVERLLFLLFACLFGLLLLSCLIIAYSNFFRNRETLFLLTAPLPNRTIFQWKLIESTVLASWAFLFLIAPLLVAYGIAHEVAWHYYLATPVLISMFIVLPGVAGACGSVWLARSLDRRTFQITALCGAVLALVWVGLSFRPETITEEMLETRILTVIDQLLVNTRFAQFPWLPSYWLSASVLHWAEGAFTAALFFATVLMSYTLFFGALASTGTGQAFYNAASAVQCRASVFGQWQWFQRRQRRRESQHSLWRNRSDKNQATLTDSAENPSTASQEETLAPKPPVPVDLLDPVLKKMGLKPTARALVAKDIRVFWRDTAQWGQTVLLFGLLAVYILNLRHFTRQLDSPFWIHIVSFLNLGACALNVATLTTRFVFPQFSLEGRRVWLIGLAPIALTDVLRLKFKLTSGATWLVTGSLTLLSCHLLGLDGWHQLYFGLAISIMTLTLNAVAIGLGALYPNFRETQPSKIVSGFGGTFCLVLSFLYIVGSVVVLASGSPWSWRGDEILAGRATLSIAIFLAFSLLIGWLPFRLAMRRVEAMEL